MIRRVLFFSAACLALFGAGFWRLSDGFSLRKMEGQISYDARWEVTPPPKLHIRNILSQPFTYIGKGSQCYVFESADHDYVLKFFRLSRYRLPEFQQKLPLPPFLAEIQQKRLAEKQEKLEVLFASCTLAYTLLKQECGLIYLHLNPTTHLNQEVTLCDSFKRPHRISIDRYAFVIQRKGELVYAYLGDLLKAGKRDAVKQALVDLAKLIETRHARGVADRDAQLHKNAGFYKGKPCFLDIGQFRQEPVNEDPVHVMRRILAWLENKDPELAAETKSLLAFPDGGKHRA